VLKLAVIEANLLSVLRYSIGKLSLPFFTQWVLDKFDIDLNSAKSAQPMPKQDSLPSPIVDAGTVQLYNLGFVVNTLL
jgi:hypothetical protein